jgi:hexokinase
LCKPLVLSNNQLRQIMARMEESFVDGLLQDSGGLFLTLKTNLKLNNSEKKPAVKMLPTYIRSVDIGEERGKFLALDLGGTHFRVLLITLEGNGKSTMKSKLFDLPDQFQKGSGIAVSEYT